MSDKKGGNNTGVSFFGLLTILFIGLKLSGHITWSWIWVLSPLWGPILLVMIVAGLIAGTNAVTENKK